MFNVAAVYKTGEKQINRFSCKGPKPQGFNIYTKGGILLTYIRNIWGVYSLYAQEYGADIIVRPCYV